MLMPLAPDLYLLMRMTVILAHTAPYTANLRHRSTDQEVAAASMAPHVSETSKHYSQVQLSSQVFVVMSPGADHRATADRPG